MFGTDNTRSPPGFEYSAYFPQCLERVHKMLNNMPQCNDIEKIRRQLQIDKVPLITSKRRAFPALPGKLRAVALPTEGFEFSEHKSPAASYV